MKLPILLAAATATLIAMPATAQKKFDETVGTWRITGDKGDCVAFFGAATGMVMIASPASGGENNGGIVVAKQGLSDDPNQETQLFGPGDMKGPLAIRPMEEGSDPLYWRSFPSADTTASFPDSWPVMLKRGGVTLVTVNVTGFSAARATLKRCADTTR